MTTGQTEDANSGAPASMAGSSSQSMESLYEQLLQPTFTDSALAIEYCRNMCAEFGFTIKQEASANRNIYVYCSREGLPDSKRNSKPTQRKRPSKRCDCRWRVVLSENNGRWAFRKSMNPNASEHNHEMMSPEEMVKSWPAEVNNTIIQLARRRLQTNEIREAVKQQFPNITWNERRFYNRLTEERKRMRQKGVVERSQRLVTLSARLCALVAGFEDWSRCVESELTRMIDYFGQLSRVSPDAMEQLVDLPIDQIQIEPDRHGSPSPPSTALVGTGTGSSVAMTSASRSTVSVTDMPLHLSLQTTTYSLTRQGSDRGVSSRATSIDEAMSVCDLTDDDFSPITFTSRATSPTKKRKSVSNFRLDSTSKGTQSVYVPSYTVRIRTQSLRSYSDSSSIGRAGRSAEDSPMSPDHVQTSGGNTIQMVPPPGGYAAKPPSSSLLSLASPTSSSSSSSSSMMYQPTPPHAPDRRGRKVQMIHSPTDTAPAMPPPPANQPAPYAVPEMSNYTIQPAFSQYTVPATASYSSPTSISFPLDMAYSPQTSKMSLDQDGTHCLTQAGSQRSNSMFDLYAIKQEPIPEQIHPHQQRPDIQRPQEYELSHCVPNAVSPHLPPQSMLNYGTPLPTMRPNEERDKAPIHESLSVSHPQHPSASWS